MAARLTDKQKKKIVADYVQLESYNAVAKLNRVSKDTVKRIVQNCEDFAQKAQQKKEQNTADIIAYMESQKNDVCELLGLYINELKNPLKIQAAALKELAVVLGVVIDKYTKFTGDNIADNQSEDALSKSLRELGEGLESDGD